MSAVNGQTIMDEIEDRVSDAIAAATRGVDCPDFGHELRDAVVDVEQEAGTIADLPLDKRRVIGGKFKRLADDEEIEARFKDCLAIGELKEFRREADRLAGATSAGSREGIVDSTRELINLIEFWFDLPAFPVRDMGARCRDATAAALEVVIEECGDRDGRIEEVTDDVFVFVEEDGDEEFDIEAELEAALEDLRDED